MGPSHRTSGSATAGGSLIVIAGPTAAGKTAVAIALAQKLGAEIVCADSRTIYRGMDIGTAKPALSERALVPHHLLDIADPDEPVTLAAYQRLALDAIEGIHGRGRAALLVGGTGLYIRAVVDHVVVPAVAPDWDLRARLADEERTAGAGTLHRRLEQTDPAAAARIHPRNIRRVIRALEVHAVTGQPMSLLQPQITEGRWAAGAVGGQGMIALTLDRERLYDRIERRIAAQLAAGFVDEVQTLLRAGYGGTLPAMQALGYKEIGAYIEGETSLDEAAEQWRRNTRRYAKRQWTWFRADPRYRWIDVDDEPAARVVGRIVEMLAGAERSERSML